jgi:hypothetical protein
MALQQVGGAESKSGISRLTREYLYWRIQSNNDLSGAAASVAFVIDDTGRPTTENWTAADIVPDPDDGTKFAIRLLVGPNTDRDLTPVSTDAVTYRVWIKLEIGSESIVRRVGTLLVR